MEFLQEKSRPIYAIARYLQVCERTVYRYFKLFEALGYKIEKDHYNKYKLIK
jgi:predicted DNA-binding transcriptional regulator YafY